MAKSKVLASTVVAALAATTEMAVADASVTTEVAAPVAKKTLSARAKELFETTTLDAADRGRAFRKTILQTLMAEFPGTSIASAAGAYNNAKTAAQKADPARYASLGREPGKNNGGPKKRQFTPEVTTEAAAEATA